MKKTIYLTFTTLLLCVLMVLGLTACGDKCEHAYDNACDAICNECEETREVGSHDWSAATCTASKTCKICGLTEGESLGHEWTTPDVDLCEVQSTCSRCGATDGQNKEHSPETDDGDCTTEVKCSVCGDVTTPAGQHTPNEDDGDCTTPITCSVCGTTTTPAKDSHTGGTATCTEKAKCTACGTAYGAIDVNNHIDENTDHICDHECGMTDIGAHDDGNKDHTCDYGCSVAIGTHADTNNDHNCEYGCSTTIGTHSDSEDDDDHVCDYGCGATLEEHKGGTATCASGKHCEVCNTEYDTTKNPDNHDLTTVDDNNVCGCGQLLTFVITNSGVTTNYDNFADALAAWTDGTILTLFSDATCSEDINLTAKGLTLDLNGHTLASTATRTIWVDGASELTIRDSKDSGQIKGTVIAGWNSGSGSGTILLESGKLEQVSVGGIFTMTGGTVRNENGVAINVNNATDTVLISGGEIYGSTYGVWITSGNVIISDTVKITGAGQYAITSFSSKVVISGTPTISGSVGEFYLSEKITLNTQPADGEVWRVKIDTGNNSDIKDGIFAIPGEGVTLDVSKFASAMDGYEVKKNDKGELLLCNHAVSYYAVANGDGTHNMTCWCGGTVLETNLACSGGMATDTLLALCQYCGVAYGELAPNVHYDIYTANMTEEELQTALTELLLAGQTEISIFLADADAKMLAAIDAALNSSGVDKDNVKLTFGSQNVVQNEEQLTRALENGGIILLTADIVLTEPEYVKKNTTIALNGFTLTPGVLGLGVEEGCTLTVIGDGNVNGGEGLWVFDGTLNLQGGTVDYLAVNETVGNAIISGGKVTTLIAAYGGTVNISGGYVGEFKNYEGTLIITGGTFGFDPTEYLAEGYTATHNETDGIWTVTQNN